MTLPDLPDRPRATGYPLEGRTEFQGLQISLEHLPGSVRSGVSPDGTPWQTTMRNPYGYIRMTQGTDGDHLDCYLGPDDQASEAYIIDALNPSTGEFDEHKVMLGFPNEQAAVSAFLAHYDNPAFLGPVKALDMDTFRGLVLHRPNWGKRISKAADPMQIIRESEDIFRQMLRQYAPRYATTVNPENTSSGVCVCLPIPSGIAEQLTVPGGLPASTLHITLAFLGKVGEVDMQALEAFKRRLSWMVSGMLPLTGTINGQGRFHTPSGKDAVWLSLDSPGINRVQAQVAEMAQASGLRVSDEHGFIPHITLTYVQAGTPSPLSAPTLAFRFKGLAVWEGGTEHHFPFTDEPRLAKAHREPLADARAMLANLTGDLVRIHDTSRRINRAANALHEQHGVNLAGLGSAVRAARGSALEDAALHHADEAATARRLASVT